MGARFIGLLLFISLAQQGLASPLTPIPDERLREEQYSGIIKAGLDVVTDVVPQLKFAADLIRGAVYCKEVFAEVVSHFGRHIETIHGFPIDVKEAYKNFQRCDEITDDNAVVVCKEVVKLEYIDSVKTRFRKLGETLYATISNAMKLPTCIFVRN